MCELFVRRDIDPLVYSVWCREHRKTISAVNGERDGGNLEQLLLGVQRHLSVRKGEFMAARVVKHPCDDCGADEVLEHPTGQQECVGCGRARRM